MLKSIAGHTSTRGIRRYLTRKNRALAADYLNIDAPPDDRAFDWAAVMDSTRRAFGNDLPWRGRRVRTYKHYIVSPDPKDRVSLEALRGLARSWAEEHFADYEVAIVYHDDNEGGIPHAHVVVSNTNLETGRRLQDPDPKALASSLQELAQSQGLTPLAPPAAQGVAARAERRANRPRPKTYRSEYVRRAEKELVDRGEYSWTADIRSRVRIARSIARSEGEFRSLLGTLGVTVSDNSPNAQRRDWIYALADRPSRRIGGERLGLSYSRERLEPLLHSGGMRRLSDASERTVAEIARRAVEVGSLSELSLLSRAVALIESSRAVCISDLEAIAESGGESSAVAAYARAARILPEERPPAPSRRPASRGVSGGQRQGTRRQEPRRPNEERRREELGR